MAWSLIAHTAAPEVGGVCTTSPIDTTGADLIIIFQVYEGLSPSPSDSESNTWVLAGTPINDTFGDKSSAWYVANPTTSSTHTFSTAGAGGYSVIGVQAWSGSAASPLDQYNGQSDPGVPFQPGSITPTENNELIVAALCGVVEDTATIDSGFTALEQLFATANNYSLAHAYYVQSTAAAINPTWDDYADLYGDIAGIIVSFKPASGGATLVVDRTLPIEWLAVSAATAGIMPFEMLASDTRDGVMPIENPARAIRDEPAPDEGTAMVAFHLGLPSIEALSGQRVEIGATLEALLTAVVNTNFRGEALGAVPAQHTIESEFLQTKLFTSDSLLAIEWLKTALSDQSIGDEWLGAIHRVSTAELELVRTLLHHVVAPGEITGSARGDSSLLDEATGTLTTLLANAAIPIEVNGSIAVAGDGIATEIIARAIADIRVPAEFLSFARHDEPARAEFLAGLSMRDNAVAFELLALLHSLHRLPIEWSALPAIMRVSLQRLLASPSKRRILGTPGRFRLLKHQ